MNRTFLLLKTQVINYFSLNEIFGQHGGKQGPVFITAAGIFTLLLFLGGYNVLTAAALVSMGQQDMIPAYMVAVSSFIILVFTLLRSNGILFGSRDFEMLCALPLEAGEIISSKFGFLYLINLAFSALFMVPAGVVWLTGTRGHGVPFFFYLVSVFFVPLIPMCAASAAGFVITRLSAGSRRKNLLSLVFSFGALGLLLGAGIYGMYGDVKEGSLGTVLAGQIGRLYPMSSWFRYPHRLSVLWNVVFWLVSVLAFWVFVRITAVHYTRLNAILLENHASAAGKAGFMRRSSFAAMYRKELGRYFGSYLYVLNTGLGVVCLLVVCGAICVIPPEKLGGYAGIEDAVSFFGQYAPLIVAAMLSLSCPAASSVSLEGKNIWILQSVPLPFRTFLNSKIAVTLSLHAVGYLTALPVFMLRFQMDGARLAALIVIPAVYSIFTAVQGICINCCFPRFDWDNEMVVIKQSMAVILSGVTGMLCVAVPAILHWFFRLPLGMVLWGWAGILLCVSGLLYWKACQTKII